MVTTPPIYERASIGSMLSRDGDSFTIAIGLDHPLIEQLVDFSNDHTDTELQANTSDKQRFSEGSYESWFAKDRTPYALISSRGELAALAWFGPKPLGRKSLRYLSEAEAKEEGRQNPSEWHTIVYRSYAPYRGRGLMRTFMQAVIADYKQRYPKAKLWAGISEHNAASIALASTFGFVKSEEYSDSHQAWVAMIEQRPSDKE
jgi:RimJ/RimL family protein N-acetyltransferase